MMMCFRQEAVQAAISEKDATIALLEMTSTKKQRNLEEIERLTHEKHRLQASLREVVSQSFAVVQEGSVEYRRLQATARCGIVILRVLYFWHGNLQLD